MAHGPMIIAVNSNDNWYEYDSGVFYDPTCNREQVNHAVLLVGFGTTPKKEKFWSKNFFSHLFSFLIY
jgi:hypothetical protein